MSQYPKVRHHRLYPSVLVKDANEEAAKAPDSLGWSDWRPPEHTGGTVTGPRPQGNDNLVHIPELTEGFHRTPNAPGWYQPTQDGKPLKPYIRCNCGSISGIGLHHVHADGRVTASFYHKRGSVYPEDPNGCEWHVWLFLDGYKGGDFPPRT